MFSYSEFNQQIGSWDVSIGRSFGYMFRDCPSFCHPIDGWNISKGKYFQEMFALSEFNQPIDRQMGRFQWRILLRHFFQCYIIQPGLV
jgi:hypothetical protein